MNINYADALIKARRYEAMAENAIINDDEYISEGIKDFFSKNKEKESKPGRQHLGAIGPNKNKKAENRKNAIGYGLNNVKNKAGEVGNAVKDKAGAGIDWAKAHPGKTAAIGAGVAAAAGAGAALAAKKIADKKKAAKKAEVEVKENYEYEEYNTLVETVINNFMSDEEIMSENAAQIAMATADYMIDHIDEM